MFASHDPSGKGPIKIAQKRQTVLCIAMISINVYFFTLLADNWNSKYLKKDEVTPGVQAGTYEGEVKSDVTTSFFILLAIFFPSVTGE